jgi:putative ATPase
MFHTDKPLAERVRPYQIDEIIGQEHLTGPNAVLRQILLKKSIPSLIFWGSPGVGKTTLAKIIGNQVGLNFYFLSAIQAGVAEVRKVIDDAKKIGKVLLFIDEIHRFNKSQQDALLGAVENGLIVLIGATTENPSFEVNSALLSRCQVYILNELTTVDLKKVIDQAKEKDEWLMHSNFELKETDALFKHSAGDARKLLNLLELIILQFSNDEPKIITNQLVEQVLIHKTNLYDKNGESHYNVISAFIKSLRGSDPNAAIYYLACMLNAGEDPAFIARRMLILAAEDIGNANPNALLLAQSCFESVKVIGMPEGRIILAQCATYLACSPKSNAAYMAIEEAMSFVSKNGIGQVPLHLRNAPTKLMKELNYGNDYAYAHSFENNFVDLEFLPKGIEGTKFYEPGKNAKEIEMRAFLKSRWKNKYGY